MPNFELIKYPEFEGDSEVRMTFTTDQLQVLQENFQDFVRGAGFEVELADDQEPDFERRLTQEDFLAKEEDYLWDDAFKHKFRDNVFQLNSDYLESK